MSVLSRSIYLEHSDGYDTVDLIMNFNLRMNNIEPDITNNFVISVFLPSYSKCEAVSYRVLSKKVLALTESAYLLVRKLQRIKWTQL